MPNTSVMHTTTADLLTAKAVCERLGCDRSTLSRWVKEGFITPALKFPGPRGAFLFAPIEIDRVEPHALDRLAKRKKDDVA